MQLGNELLTEYKRHLLAHGKLLATVISYECDARSFIQYLIAVKKSPILHGIEDLASFQNYLELDEKESINSIRRKIIGIKSFLRFAIPRMTQKSSGFEDYPIPNRHDQLPDCLTADDVEALMDLARKQIPSLKGLRDKAILSCLAFEGLKVNEIIDLNTSDIAFHTNGATCFIRGPRDRLIYLCHDTSLAIKEYLTELRQINNVGRSLFVAVRGRQINLSSRGITRHGIKFILYELGLSCAIKHLNSELLRHFAMDFQLRVRGQTTEQVMNHFGLRQPGNIGRHAKRIDADNEC